MPNWILSPLPWYIAGPLIGLMVPLLLLIGNKAFGISSTLRHVCAACFPSNIFFFRYDWKKEIWNLVFATGILVGAILTTLFLTDHAPVKINPATHDYLANHGITRFELLLPSDLFNWENLLSVKGLVFIIAGGFLVGFGTRYAGGCTSGHSIMGLSNLQWPSLVATICFMVGGFLVANLVIPLIL